MRGMMGMALAGLALSVPMPASAKFMSLPDLHKACAAEQGSPAFILHYTECLQYISGVSDYLDEQRVLEGKHACIPEAMRNFELRQIVLTYLAAHPETWHLPAPGIVRQALQQGIPSCNKD